MLAGLDSWLRDGYVSLRESDSAFAVAGLAVARNVRNVAVTSLSGTRRQARRLRRAMHQVLLLSPRARADAALAKRLSLLAATGGLDPVLRQLEADRKDGGRRADILLAIAQQLEGGDRANAIRCLTLAYDAAPGEQRAGKIAAMLFNLGDIAQADRLSRLSRDPKALFAKSDLWLAARLHRSTPILSPRSKPVTPGAGIAYVAASAPPYVNAGYTVRTHQLLSGLVAADVPVRCYLRPGYPWDRQDTDVSNRDVPEQLHVDAVTYVHSRLDASEREHLMERSADLLERHWRVQPPRVVQAASNCRNALPALMAARRLGVPFVYEVRGLWELTAAVTRPDWETTERFALDRKLEALVAREADHVLAITQALAEELVSFGVPAAAITILPNAVDPAQFLPRAKDAELVERFGLRTVDLTLVYAGSLTAYEGLDDLIEALGLLRSRGRVAKLIVVGDGREVGPLRALVSQRGLTDEVRFVGRVAPGEVARYWSLADVVALARKNHRVCRIVSPLKPFEVMAMQIPLILSDLPVMHEIVRDGVTGRICQPDDPANLAMVLEQLIDDPAQRARLGAAGRAWLLANRTWAANAQKLIDLYSRLSPAAPARMD